MPVIVTKLMPKGFKPSVKIGSNTILVVFSIRFEWIKMIVRDKFVQADAKLADIVDAVNLSRSFHG